MTKFSRTWGKSKSPAISDDEFRNVGTAPAPSPGSRWWCMENYAAMVPSVPGFQVGLIHCDVCPCSHEAQLVRCHDCC